MGASPNPNIIPKRPVITVMTALVTALAEGGYFVLPIARCGQQLLATLLDIRQFESVYATGARKPDALIQIHAKVLEYPSNRVIAAKTFAVEAPSASKEIPDVVLAFESGLNSAIADIAAWTLANGRSKTK